MGLDSSDGEVGLSHDDYFQPKELIEEHSASINLPEDEKKPLVPVGFFNPQSRVFRGIILAGCCLLTFGSYYCYDLPGALTDTIEKFYHISSFEYELLYSVYSFPNMVLPFFGGILVDRVFGVRLGGIIFCSIISFGQLIWASGSLIPNDKFAYYVALCGRFTFGLGGESLSVCQSTYAAKWFTGKELALAFGITLSFSRIGSAFNFLVSPIIAKFLGFPLTLFWGFSLCFVSATAACTLAFFDWKASKSGLGKEVSNDEKISLKDVIYFPITIWFVYGICVTFYISIFVFITLASAYFQQKWGFSQELAGICASIPYACAAVMSPLFGFLVDRFGRSVSWVTGACAGCVLAFVVFQSFPGESAYAFAPFLGMFILGTCYSLCAASLWPMVPLIVKSHELGTAYGLMTAIQNSGLAIFPLIVGRLTSTHEYTGVIFVFMGCSFIAMIISIGLICIDIARQGDLNASSAVLKARLMRMKTEAEKEKMPTEEDHLETPSPLVDDGKIVRERVSSTRSETSTTSEIESPDPAQLLRPRSVRVVRNQYLLRIGILPSAGIPMART